MTHSLKETLSLYLVTDPVLHGGRGVIPTVRLALEAGVRIVQLRDKEASTRQLLREAKQLRALCESYSAVFVVNDRVDVALVSGAHGVHLGQDDMQADEAREILGPDVIIGVSVRTVKEAIEASATGADYIAANMVFSTATKTDIEEPLGIEMVKELSRASRLPLVAIGGIKPENAGLMIKAGCAGVAVVSAIMNAEDPGMEVRRFLEALSP